MLSDRVNTNEYIYVSGSKQNTGEDLDYTEVVCKCLLR
jgi:hypothetical protein